MPNVIVFARLASCVKKTRMAFERFYGCPTDKGLFGHGDCWERAVGSALECPTKCLEKKQKKKGSQFLTRSIPSVSVLSPDDETALECPKGLSESRLYLSLSRGPASVPMIHIRIVAQLGRHSDRLFIKSRIVIDNYLKRFSG